MIHHSFQGRAVGKHFRCTGGDECGGGFHPAFGIELGLLVAEDFLAVHAVDDLLRATDFDLDFHPLSRREGGSGGLDDVLGDEFAIHLDVGAGGADVRGGTRSLALVGEELELDADGKRLVKSHMTAGESYRHIFFLSGLNRQSCYPASVER